MRKKTLRQLPPERLLVLGCLVERGPLRPAELRAHLADDFGWRVGKNALNVLTIRLRRLGLIRASLARGCLRFEATDAAFLAWREQLAWMDQVLGRWKDFTAMPALPVRCLDCGQPEATCTCREPSELELGRRRAAVRTEWDEREHRRRAGLNPDIEPVEIRVCRSSH